MDNKRHLEIPIEVSHVTQILQKNGFEAYLIGGCVRDLLRDKKPKDWDITTNALPEDVLKLFPKAFYENDFGTVGVVNESVSDETVEVVEVTTYRLEATYSDSRHPDTIMFSKKLEDDLKRRDFTINAIAYDISHETIVDQFGGQDDLNQKIVRAVGNPDERFKEDALRIVRAIRIAADLDFDIAQETADAIKHDAQMLTKIAVERVREEFIRIVSCEKAMRGILLAQELGVLRYIIPELEQGIGIEQNQAHSYDVFEHNLRTMQHAADKGWDLDMRLAALFHDIGKTKTRRWSNEKKDWTFYGHDVIGSRETEIILRRLKFPIKQVEKIVKMVRWHMFFSDPAIVTHSAVRRMMNNVGKENIWDLMNLRICDRIGTGRPKEQPYRFRKYKSMIEEAMRDPISVRMLAISGNHIKDILNVPQGTTIGLILNALLEEVLDAPEKNSREYLTERVQQLGALPQEQLEKVAFEGKTKKQSLEEQELQKIRSKYYVQ